MNGMNVGKQPALLMSCDNRTKNRKSKCDAESQIPNEPKRPHHPDLC